MRSIGGGRHETRDTGLAIGHWVSGKSRVVSPSFAFSRTEPGVRLDARKRGLGCFCRLRRTEDRAFQGPPPRPSEATRSSPSTERQRGSLGTSLSNCRSGSKQIRQGWQRWPVGPEGARSVAGRGSSNPSQGGEAAGREGSMRSIGGGRHETRDTRLAIGCRGNRGSCRPLSRFRARIRSQGSDLMRENAVWGASVGYAVPRTGLFKVLPLDRASAREFGDILVELQKRQQADSARLAKVARRAGGGKKRRGSRVFKPLPRRRSRRTGGVDAKHRGWETRDTRHETGHRVSGKSRVVSPSFAFSRTDPEPGVRLDARKRGFGGGHAIHPSTVVRATSRPR